MVTARTESRIDHVTLYANGARVRRIATLVRPLPPILTISDLPIAMIDDTVRVEVASGGVVRGVRVMLDAPRTSPDAETSETLAAARRRAEIADAEVERIAHALELSVGASIVEEDPTDDAPAPWTEVIAARRALLVARGQRELALREAHAKAAREAEIAGEALRLVEKAESAASSARAPKPNELRKTIEVEIAASGGGASSDASGGGTVELRIEYQVAGARWAPAYVARLDGDAVRVELRAVVAQCSGEDWTNIGLDLSTAEPDRFSILPELAAQRIGRRQDAPARGGFRPPPTGARTLYADYERSFPPPASVPPTTISTITTEREISVELDDAIAAEVWDEESSNAKEAFHTPPAGTTPTRSMMPEQQAFRRSVAGSAGGGGRLSGRDELMKKRGKTGTPFQNAPAPQPQAQSYLMREKSAVSDERGRHEPAAAIDQNIGAPIPRLDYGNLRMAPPSSISRGSLIPAQRDDPHAHAVAAELGARARRLADLPMPPGCSAGWDHAYDYAYAADGRIDVRADGAWTSLAIAAKSGTSKVRHVAVPREQADAFRVASIANPFAGPLLPGPIDVYDRGQFLVTSTVDFTPPGGTVEIGLGVDPLVKIARNTEFREEAAGMLRGALKLVHGIIVDVENLGARPIEIEIRERIPVVREGDDDVEITIGKIDPAWEPWSPPPDSPNERRLRGGQRWRLSVAANAKRTLRAGYEVKIASKHELVGGNRRER